MDDKRNRIIELKNYIESLGIIVNIGKNKARGNKGFFMNKGANSLRIDVAKNIDDDATLSTILHEFAHYIHYKNDASLKSLSFIFDDFSEEMQEELINVTVENIPKNFAKNLLDLKDKTKNEINNLTEKIKQIYPNFKKSENNKLIEKNIKIPAKYLIKYDCIKYLNNIYTIQNIEKDFEYLSCEQIYYIKLKGLQRKLTKINSRIRKLNNYYNQPTELWARFFEAYFIDKNIKAKAPITTQILDNAIKNNQYKEINYLYKILKL